MRIKIVGYGNEKKETSFCATQSQITLIFYYGKKGEKEIIFFAQLQNSV